jgi:hypothetical protein
MIKQAQASMRTNNYKQTLKLIPSSYFELAQPKSSKQYLEERTLTIMKLEYGGREHKIQRNMGRVSSLTKFTHEKQASLKQIGRERLDKPNRKGMNRLSTYYETLLYNKNREK